MTGSIEWGQLAGAVVFLITVGGAMWAVWFRIEGKVASAADKAEKVADDLSAHRLHVAETYLTKAGIREWRDEIMSAMVGLKEDLRHLSSRIDGIHNK